MQPQKGRETRKVLVKTLEASFTVDENVTVQGEDSLVVPQSIPHSQVHDGQYRKYTSIQVIQSMKSCTHLFREAILKAQCPSVGGRRTAHKENEELRILLLS